MYLQSMSHSLVFLFISGIVTGVPAKKDWDGTCPESCNVETSHPGCIRSNGVCHQLEEMLENEKSLKVTVAVLCVFILILSLGLALVILKLYLPSFFKSFKKCSKPERKTKAPQCQYLGQIPSAAQHLQQLSVSNLRQPNHHRINQRPCPTENRIQRQATHSTPVPEENTQQLQQPRKLMRQPSESTCPTESSDTSQGSHNLPDQSSFSSSRSLHGSNTSTRTSSSTLPPDTTQ